MVFLERVRHRYGRTAVLDLPHFSLAQGERCLVLGRSGSGKATLLHVLAGLLRLGQGLIEVAKHDLCTLRGDVLDRFGSRHVGVVFQQMHLLPTLTVEQNPLLAPVMAGPPQDAARAREVLRPRPGGEGAPQQAVERAAAPAPPGPLAELELGPTVRNLAGAHAAADRLSAR